MAAEEAGRLWRGYDRSQLLRLMMETLREMGYSETVQTLERESGCRYQSEEINNLESVILSGDMKRARTLLSQLKLPSDILMACVFLCSQQSFANALYHKDLEKALRILREELTPSAFDEETKTRVKLCASLLVYPTTEQILKRELKWEAENSLSTLWMYIRQLISPEQCVPPGRLLTLLRQAQEHQEIYCRNHRKLKNDKQVPCLYEDHTCRDTGSPTTCITRLDGHVDEIWDISISPNGDYIATAGMDKCVIVWQTSHPFQILHNWEEHNNMVISVDWSTDSKLLASLSCTGDIVIFALGCASSLAKIANASGPHNYMCWVPGKRAIITGGEMKMTVYGLSGVTEEGLPLHAGNAENAEMGPNAVNRPADHYRVDVLRKWNIEARMRSLAVNYDGSYAYFSTPDCKLHILDLHDFKEQEPLHENATISMLTSSALYNHVLVSISGQNPVLRLWDMEERRLIQTYHGHREERYVLKPAFGGPDECYVVSGSEDTQIYIWNKLFGTLVSVIPAHSSTVNAVAWNITGNSLLYSVADDGQVAVWEHLMLDEETDDSDML